MSSFLVSGVTEMFISFDLDSVLYKIFRYGSKAGQLYYWCGGTWVWNNFNYYVTYKLLTIRNKQQSAEIAVIDELLELLKAPTLAQTEMFNGI